jgi:hypothetical protein
MNVFYKDKLTPPPPALRLQEDTFILCVDPFPNQGILVPQGWWIHWHQCHAQCDSFLGCASFYNHC